MISFSWDWPDLIGSHNWQTFRFIHASVEVDSLLGQFVLEAALLGFGLRFTWVFDPDTEMRTEFSDLSWIENASVVMKVSEHRELQAKADAYDKLQEAGREHGA